MKKFTFIVGLLLFSQHMALFKLLAADDDDDDVAMTKKWTSNVHAYNVMPGYELEFYRENLKKSYELAQQAIVSGDYRASYIVGLIGLLDRDFTPLIDVERTLTTAASFNVAEAKFWLGILYLNYWSLYDDIPVIDVVKKDTKKDCS